MDVLKLVGGAFLLSVVAIFLYRRLRDSDDGYVDIETQKRIRNYPSQRLDVQDAIARTIGKPEYKPGPRQLAPSGKR